MRKMKIRQKFQFVWALHILLACLFSGGALAATGKVATLNATADAFVRGGAYNKYNYGTNKTLKVQTNGTASKNYDTYLKFDLSSVGSSIASTKLRLNAALSGTGSVTSSIYSVSNTSWNESGANPITWANKPAKEQIIGSIAVSSKTYSWVEVDISSYVRSEKAAGRNLISVAIHNTNNTNLTIFANSREASTNMPQLVVTENLAPTVSIVAPKTGATISTPTATPAAVVLEAAAADSDGSVAKVEFYQGATLLGPPATSSPYRFTWNVPVGDYTVTAVATDNLGFQTQSTPVTFHVVSVFSAAPTDKLLLQQLLDAYDTVLLQANADYRTEGMAKLVVSSNKKLIGGYRTLVPQIEIPGGASNVTIDGVIGGGWGYRDIKFTGGAPNYNVTIIGGSNGPGYNPYLGFDQGAQVEGLRATYIGGIEANLSTAGYIRNSVFQAIAAYSPGINISMMGNTVTPSYGNAILKFASTTPGGAANISTFGDMYFLQADVESWSCYLQDRYPRQQRAFIFSNMNSLRMVGPSGGSGSGCGTRWPPGAMLEISSTPSVVQWFDLSKNGPADTSAAYLTNVSTHIVMQDFAINRSYTPTPDILLDALKRSSPVQGVFLNNSDITNGTSLTPDASNALVNSFMGAPKATAPTKPVLRVIDTLPKWQENLALQPDSAISIQSQIDSTHIVNLPPGKYYLDSPLKIGTKQRGTNGAVIVEGIIGSGKDSVYLIAKGPFPVIQVRNDVPDSTNPGIQIVLEGLSIYGGSYGLDYTNPSGYDVSTSPTVQVNWSSFRNLAFNYQTQAGVNFYYSFGIDNNIWYKVDFSNMPVAFKGTGYKSTVPATPSPGTRSSPRRWAGKRHRPAAADAASGCRCR